MHGPPKLSPDGQRVAFEYSDEAGDPSGVGILNITDREGRVLQRYPGVAWWDWHPDGGLVVAGDDAVYRIGAALGAPALVRRFAGDRPTDLAVSPDGSQLAFGLGDRDLLANHVWVMKLGGTWWCARASPTARTAAASRVQAAPSSGSCRPMRRRPT
jgi:Tol biopolymer transport system component